jgi:hypothetical protein
MQFVQKELERIKKEKAVVMAVERAGSAKDEKIKMADNNHAAFQELYELTQRKFLKQICQYADTTSLKFLYPRLFCIDLVDFVKIDEMNRLKSQDSVTTTDEMDQMVEKAEETETREPVKLTLCVRPMCEFDEGWHSSDNYLTLDNGLPGSYAYLARIMNIIKNGNLASESQVFTTQQGQQLMDEIDRKGRIGSREDHEFADVIISESYLELRRLFADACKAGRLLSFGVNSANDGSQLDLERCELKNGKTVWLCARHVAECGARPLADDSMAGGGVGVDQAGSRLLEELDREEIMKIKF